MAGEKETVTLTIDGKQITVAKGTNLIEAAKLAGVEVPYYCYHPHLSIAGNCRMCQLQVKGRPKLEIGCNTVATEGMEVSTQETSKDVADAQAATLEFILINHPLDCTVCDQAGHCKLQDYHFEYNAKPSRFLEEKVKKVKAEPLGPNVILDGERCIMCTRCIRFCDEVTGTSELGMLNRGDKCVIAVNQNKVLDNPLSGSVVDLCPVGALTHREWRFNTRIWFTKSTDGICPGCSTGCNVKTFERDGEIVQVKARLNSEVNKEWLCDEGRYGFMRFLPQKRQLHPVVSEQIVSLEQAVQAAKKLLPNTLVFIGGDLLFEEYVLLKGLIESQLTNAEVVISYKERALTDVEKILISPDYCANFRGAEFAGLVKGNLEDSYKKAVQRVLNGEVESVLILGDRGLLASDCDSQMLVGLRRAKVSVATLTDAAHPVAKAAQVVFPGRSILEKSGILVNRKGMAQYTERALDFPDSTEPEWRILNALNSKVSGKTDRDVTLWVLSNFEKLKGQSIRSMKTGAVNFAAQ